MNPLQAASVVLVLLAVSWPGPGLAAGDGGPFEAKFQYSLSTSTGVVPFSGMRLEYDPVHKETFVVGDGLVRIFNESGMEIYSFGGEPELGGIVAVAPLEDGDLLLLSYFEGKGALVRTNFRGEFRSRIEPKGLPDALPKGLLYNGMGVARGQVYLVDHGEMRLLVLDMDGNFVVARDLAQLVDVADKRADNGVKGFRVAPNGDVLFTVQPLFRAFVLAPDGSIRSFGVKGSAPGKFNIVGGIARDEKGHYYVTDILKSAVLVFGKDFRWLKEFGYRGRRPGNLVAPVDVAAGDGKVLVSQNARRGVSVFKVSNPLEQ